MAEEGVQAVPTLHSCVVIFKQISFSQGFFYNLVIGFVNANFYANYEIFVIDSDHVWQSGAWLQILFSDFMKTF